MNAFDMFRIIVEMLQLPVYVAFEQSWQRQTQRDQYRRYRAQVSMLIPLPWRRWKDTEAEDHPPLSIKVPR